MFSAEERVLALKVDVDTLKGYCEGMPRLLDILKKHGVRASVFFSMGPDNSGKALRRIFRKGFISKMLRTKAPSTYGLKTLMYGTLLPAPMIAEAAPDVIRRTLDEGHECGVHAWDHVKWQDCLPRMTREDIRAEFDRAMGLFERITGVRPRACAAPGWQVTPDSLAVQDEIGFDFCSDGRGCAPFIPVMGGVTFRTPQIPSTLPTMDEVLGCDGLSAETINDYYMGLIKPGLNVHTIHTEMEGGAMSGVFDAFMTMCAGEGVKFVTLGDAAAAWGTPQTCGIAPGYLPGRAGTLAVQKKADDN